MAIPLTADQITRAFDKWHVDYITKPGWRTHRRDPDHGSWGPVFGLGLHHTGDDAPDVADERLLWEGRPGLPGPLCNWGMRDDGVLVLMSAGRANHFGVGSQWVLGRVISQSYNMGKELTPTSDSVDGNARFYGQETMYSGGHPMTLKAYRNTVRAFAAICDAHGWTAHSAIGHREWTRRKVDPGSLHMGKFRRDVQACLDAGPGNWPVKQRPLEPGITAVRTSLRSMTANQKVPMLRKALLAADVQLAKVERR